MTNEMTFTYQTRLVLEGDQEAILQDCTSLLSLVERSLYAEVAKGKSAASCKNSFLKQFGITARQFNACKVNLEGKIKAYQANTERTVFDLKQKIQALDKDIDQLEKKPSKQMILHQKKRRRHHLFLRLLSIQKDRQKNHIPLCFGGKKLFNAQFHLEQNGFSSHAEWKEAWQEKRNSEFFLLGSKDEIAGNQTCTARMQENGKFTLRLRLPNALREKYGKYLEIKDVFFAYGQETILAALNHPDGQALSYRFKKDEKSWKIFVSTNLKKQEILSKEGQGAIGIDLNSDHIAYVETDRFGNPIKKEVIPYKTYGKTREQLKANTGEICKSIIEKAKIAKKPIVIEKLDFKNKKQTLRKEANKKFSRLLSRFAYGRFFTFLKARAFKHGIALHSVNPAFTSIIGQVNYAKRYGLSIHLAAALCIARRYQNFSEAPCSPIAKIPDGKGGHVAFVLPVRNRTKHVWHFWGQVKKKIKTVLAAHFRAIHNRSKSPVYGS